MSNLIKAILIVNAAKKGWSDEARKKAAMTRKRKTKVADAKAPKKAVKSAAPSKERTTSQLDSKLSAIRDRLSATPDKTRQTRLLKLAKAVLDQKAASQGKADEARWLSMGKTKAKAKSAHVYARAEAKMHYQQLLKEVKSGKVQSTEDIARDQARSHANEIRGEGRMG